jgi:hypothetical protein
MANMKKSKTDRMPPRRMPEGVEFPKTKRAPRKPAVKRAGVKPAPLGTPKSQAPRRGNATPAPLGTPAPRPTGRRPAMPRTTKKAPAKPVKKQEKMTPQDAAMKKILEGKYGKIYG